MMRLRFLNWVVRVWLCDEVGYLCPDCRRNWAIRNREALHVMRGSPASKEDLMPKVTMEEMVRQGFSQTSMNTGGMLGGKSQFDYPQWADNRDPEDMPDQIGPWTR